VTPSLSRYIRPFITRLFDKDKDKDKDEDSKGEAATRAKISRAAAKEAEAR